MSGVHDECSPSVLFRRLLCAGSRRMERGMPDDSGPPAVRGIVMHAWGAHRLMPQRFEPPPEPLTSDEQDIVSYYVGAVRSMKPSDDAILLVEHRVRLEEIGIVEGGTIDAAWVDLNTKRGVVFDLKTGAVPVDHPQWNEQPIAYGFGLLTDYGLSEIDAIIVQPTLEDDHRIRVARFTRVDLWHYGMAFEDGIAMTLDPAAPLRPGPKQCAHCRARFTCEARNAAVAQTTGFAALANREAVVAMTPAERGRWWSLIVSAQKRLEEVEELFRGTVIAERLDIDGFAIVPGKRGARRWKDADAALDLARVIALGAGVDPERLIEMRIRSPAEFDEVIGRSKAVRDRMEPFVTQAEASPRIAPKGSL